MKTFITIMLITTTFIGCRQKLDNELAFFENIDFSSGQYRLYLIGTEIRGFEGYQDFLIADIETLNKMKERWVFKYKVPPTACGYTYKLMLVNGDSIVKRSYINTQCEYMSGWLWFPEAYLSDYKDSFVKIGSNEIEIFEEKFGKKERP